MLRHPTLLYLGLVIVLVMTAGCKSITFNPAIAKIPMEFEGETIEVRVEQPLNPFDGCPSGRAGIAAAQVLNWDGALEEFKKAAVEKPKVWSYRLALGALLERKGDYAEALRHYEAANLLKGGKEGSPDAQAGVKRINARGK